MTHPRIPDWIRTYVPPQGWTNIFALVPANEHLYATETLFGDWDGRTLLLAKDAAPTHVIRELRDKGESRPWRHAQRSLRDAGGWKTNESLAAAAMAIPGGKLYGSATANLLYDDPRWSRALPGLDAGPLYQYLKRVLTWVLESMPNVERVVCLGQEAWSLTSAVLGRPELSRQFAQHRGTHQPLIGTCAGKRLAAFAMFHPAARVSDVEKRECWTAMIGGATPGVTAIGEEPGPRDAVADRKPTNEIRASSDWTDAGFTRSTTVTSVRDSPIRAEMVRILKNAGTSGVAWTAFGHLAWRGECNPQIVRKALNLLANRNGYRLQYQKARVGNTTSERWRIAP